MNLKLLLFIVLFFGLNGLGFSQQDNNWDTWNENNLVKIKAGKELW